MTKTSVSADSKLIFNPQNRPKNFLEANLPCRNGTWYYLEPEVIFNHLKYSYCSAQ